MAEDEFVIIRTTDTRAVHDVCLTTDDHTLAGGHGLWENKDLSYVTLKMFGSLAPTFSSVEHTVWHD